MCRCRSPLCDLVARNVRRKRGSFRCCTQCRFRRKDVSWREKVGEAINPVLKFFLESSNTADDPFPTRVHNQRVIASTGTRQLSIATVSPRSLVQPSLKKRGSSYGNQLALSRKPRTQVYICRLHTRTNIIIPAALAPLSLCELPLQRAHLGNTRCTMASLRGGGGQWPLIFSLSFLAARPLKNRRA